MKRNLALFLALIGMAVFVSPTAPDSVGWGPEGELIAVGGDISVEGETWIAADGFGGAIFVWVEEDRAEGEDDNEEKRRETEHGLGTH